MPNRINKGSSYAQFFYGADRQRYKQIAVTAAGGSLPAGTETTIYVGSLYERVTKPSGVVEHKHYVMAGGEAIAIRTLRSNSANDTRYLHKDHLGSVDVITNESGAVVQRLSYDAFGKRRDAAVWGGAPNATAWTNIAAITHRAFTFHEQLDNVDLVHMNGRVYDPDIGRFISADPFIQAPLMSQSLNRYSYVMNNPLSLVDPSGFFLKKLWKGVKGFVKKYWREAVAIGIGIWTGFTIANLVANAMKAAAVAGIALSSSAGLTGAIMIGAAAGAAYGAASAALNGGGIGDILGGAIAGGIMGGMTAGLNFQIRAMFGAPVAAGSAGGQSGCFGFTASTGETAVKMQATGINPSVLDGIRGARDARNQSSKEGVKIDLFNPNSDVIFHQRVAEYKAQPGHYSVFAHGAQDFIWDLRTGSIRSLNEDGLKTLLESFGWAPGDPVTLYACNTGLGVGSLAERFAKKYNTPVSAPNDFLWFNKNPDGFGPTWIYPYLGPPEDKVPDRSRPGTMRQFR